MVPPEILLKIMGYLDIKDLVTLGSVNSQYRAVHLDRALWKNISDKYHLESQTRKEIIKEFVRYGQWMDIIPTMKRAIQYQRLIRKIRVFMESLEQMKLSFKPPMDIDILNGKDCGTSIGQLSLFYHLFSSGQDENSPPLFGTFEIDHVIYPMWLHTYQPGGRFEKRGIVQFTGDSFIRGQSCYIIKDNQVWYKSGNTVFPRKSFIEFLSDYANDLEMKRYDVMNHCIVCFPNFGIGYNELVQGDYIIQVSTFPLPTEAGYYAKRTRIKSMKSTNVMVEITTTKRQFIQRLSDHVEFYETWYHGCPDARIRILTGDPINLKSPSTLVEYPM